MYEAMAILAGFVFCYSLSAGALERTPVNGALLFAAFGLLFGPLGLGWLDLDVSAEGLRTLAEFTLAMVLFTDASNANLGVLKKSFHIPQRLLLIGLPLTILLGFGVGALLRGALTLFEVAILATMLAPTDAALGKAVVTDDRVPPEIREGLNVESGLNDGICVPILFVFLALAVAEAGHGDGEIKPLMLVVEEIGVGAGVGLALTLLGTWAIGQTSARGWIDATWHQLPVPALALCCFALAQILGGSGFIAAFVGGLLFGAIAKTHKPKLLLAAEGTGDTLALITWVVFGAAVVGQTIDSFSWQIVLYALLSLTIVRMLPVFLVLHGMSLRAKEKLFMGWFGPRGLASIVFVVIVLNNDLPGGDVIALTAVCTILLSVILHGISANPLVKALKGRIQKNAA